MDPLSTAREAASLVVHQTDDLRWRVQPLGVAAAFRLGVAMALSLRHVLPGDEGAPDEDPEIAAARALARDGGDTLKRQIEETNNVIRMVQEVVTHLSTDGGASWLPCTLIDQEGQERYRYADGTEGAYDEGRAEQIERVYVDLSCLDADTYALICAAATKRVGEAAARVTYFRPRPGIGG